MHGRRPQPPEMSRVLFALALLAIFALVSSEQTYTKSNEFESQKWRFARSANETDSQKSTTPIPEPVKNNTTTDVTVPSTVANVTLSVKPSVNVTSEAKSTSMAPETTLKPTKPPKPERSEKPTKPPKDNSTVQNRPNLGENNTGTRKMKESDSKNASAIYVSEPIVPEEAQDFNMNEFTESQDKFFKDHNETKVEYDNHDYYNSTFTINNVTFSSYWKMLMKSGDIKVHESLSDLYRKAMPTVLSFDFPFYGQPIRNISLATAGFIYNGDYVHNWLAATQYIAPLMASFDPTMSNHSFVKYIDNGTAFTVIWEYMYLHGRKNDGAFTFAASLHQNGDIVFAYKTIPIRIELIDTVDEQHSIKVGLSDAFIINRYSTRLQKKTIYEYHRVEFQDKPITNGTLIYLTALPSCPQFTTCQSCIEHETMFKCAWCSKLNRCSNGHDRQRQDWIQGNCDNRNSTTQMQCNMVPEIPASPEEPPKSSDSYSKVYTTAADQSTSSGSSGAIVTGLMMLLIIGGIGGWVLYAYRNPHTYSGQLLIKYRPSQCRWRRGEARYTAATIHM